MKIISIVGLFYTFATVGSAENGHAMKYAIS